MKTVLIVEDESAVREMLRVVLEMAGFRCSEAKNAQEAQVKLTEAHPDLVLLDWMMPDISGIELLKRWRRAAATSSLPVIMLTARSEEDSITKGLDSGADDYVPKPFSPRELVSRVNAVLRRVNTEEAQVEMSIGALTLDPTARSVTVDSQRVALGPTEYRLLEFFLGNQGKAFSRDQILNQVWGANVYIEERTIDVHIRRLRKALAPYGFDDVIQTVRGFGYRFGFNDHQSK